VADCTLVIGTTAVRNRKLQHAVRRLEDGGRLIRKHLQTKRVALLFGSEKFGLSNEDISHCHWLLRIPTEGNISMNLGQAVAVCLYELIRNRKAVMRRGSQDHASMGEVELMTRLLLESLDHSGYIKPGTAVLTQEKVRRLMRRLKLPAEDSEVWLGILRQILWKTRQKTG
jgi:tRNA/rRNA methyltransferase